MTLLISPTELAVSSDGVLTKPLLLGDTTAEEADASDAAGRAFASSTAKEAGASNAAGRASVSTTAKGAGASYAAGRASASTTA